MCSVSGCEKPVRARGWCSTHHQRWRMHGDPLALKISPAGSGTINDCGYRMLRDGGRRRYEHVEIAEKALGKPLPAGTIVHHINEDRLDNRPENLVICPSRSYHALIHARMRALAACGNPDFRPCQFCKRFDALESMRASGAAHYHVACKREHDKSRRALIANKGAST